MKRYLAVLVFALSAFGQPASTRIPYNAPTPASAHIPAGGIGAVSTPIDSPGAGSYGSAQTITITATNSTSIRYTVDGSAPACPSTGTPYSGGFTSPSSTFTLKAIGCQAGWNPSAVDSSVYTISAGLTITYVNHGSCGYSAPVSGCTITLSGAGSCSGANTFVVGLVGYVGSAASGTMTDTTIGTLTPQSNYESTGPADTALWYGFGALTGSETVTVGTPSNGTSFSIAFAECFAVSGTPSADGTGNGATTSVNISPPWSGGSLTTTVNGELVVAVAGEDNVGDSGWTMAGPFTGTDSFNFISGTHIDGVMGYYIVPTSGTVVTPSFSWSGGSAQPVSATIMIK